MIGHQDVINAITYCNGRFTSLLRRHRRSLLVNEANATRRSSVLYPFMDLFVEGDLPLFAHGRLLIRQNRETVYSSVLEFVFRSACLLTCLRNNNDHVAHGRLRLSAHVTTLLRNNEGVQASEVNGNYGNLRLGVINVRGHCRFNDENSKYSRSEDFCLLVNRHRNSRYLVLPLIRFFNDLFRRSVFSSTFLRRSFEHALCRRVNLTVGFYRNYRRLSLNERERLLRRIRLLTRFFVVLTLNVRPRRRDQLNEVSSEFTIVRLNYEIRNSNDVRRHLVTLLRFRNTRLRLILNGHANFVNASRNGNARNFTNVRLTRRVIQLRRPSRIRHREGNGHRQRSLQRHRRGRNGDRRRMFRRSFYRVRVVLTAPYQINRSVIGRRSRRNYRECRKTCLKGRLYRLVRLRIGQYLRQDLFNEFLHRLAGLNDVTRNDGRRLTPAVRRRNEARSSIT